MEKGVQYMYVMSFAGNFFKLPVTYSCTICTLLCQLVIFNNLHVFFFWFEHLKDPCTHTCAVVEKNVCDVMNLLQKFVKLHFPLFHMMAIDFKGKVKLT